MGTAGHTPRFGLWRVAYSVAALLACRAPGARAQDTDSDDTCSVIKVSGLSEEDGFPSDDELYTNDLGDSYYGKYISEDESYFVWYSLVDPTDHTSDMGDASISVCTGQWVISSYPVGDTFTDLVWYQAAAGVVQCEKSPSELESSEWIKMEREVTSSSTTATVESGDSSAVGVECFVESDDDGGGGLSNKTVIVLLIVIGIGFMVLMCLGALACCIKGKNSNEEGFMPPGELGEGSVIGGKAGDATKPGLHAHPEVQGAQHPRPEEWAPAYNSGSSAIPLGSRSGPSVRSIGYS